MLTYAPPSVTHNVLAFGVVRGSSLAVYSLKPTFSSGVNECACDANPKPSMKSLVGDVKDMELKDVSPDGPPYLHRIATENG
ncbi:hypothetical protein HUJ05_006597 [Dendroctonus ponderosae]|nr:hypothetical protein HUJ05_006597 [Dendroctonus ponderosae]